MAVYYKFKSAREYDSIPIESQFISVGTLKERIFESKHLGRGTDFDLEVSNAQTNEEYVDESAMIPKNTSVLIRRVPGCRRMPIVAEPNEAKFEEEKVEQTPLLSNMTTGDSSNVTFHLDSELDEFGNDLYALPAMQQPRNPLVDISITSKMDEENKIKALVETPALDWTSQGQGGYGGGRGYGAGGRMMPGRGFGRGGFERKTPPEGYVCHRCKVPGHFIQHCPTNGDPTYDVRTVKAPTGIPKSMLMATPDGSYMLPTGAVAVLKPNEDAFDKEVDGLPSTRQISDIPPELRCPLCKEAMKDAVLTSKCCFRSYCDKCIREYTITKSMCPCGAKDVLADDLLPNLVLRETISSLLESTTSSTDNLGSLAHVQDMESSRFVRPRVPSPTISVASKDEPEQSLPVSYSATKVDKKEDDDASEGKIINDLNHGLEKKSSGSTDMSGAKLDGEQGKKKKKKKTSAATNVSDIQGDAYQDFVAENYAGMPMAAYNPYWNGGMPMGMDGYMTPFGGGMPMPYMGYTPGPMGLPFAGMMPQDPFLAQSYMMQGFPPSDLSEFPMGLNQRPSISQQPPMSRGEFEAMKADIRKKHEFERRNERESARDIRGNVREHGVRVRDGGSSIMTKPRSPKSQTGRFERPERSTAGDRHSGGRTRPSPTPPRPPKRRSSDEYHHHIDTSVTSVEDRKHKSSVFSRVDSARDDSNKKRKVSSSSDSHHTRDHHRKEKEVSIYNGYKKNSYEQESSDEEERHFKRRRRSHSSRRE